MDERSLTYKIKKYNPYEYLAPLNKPDLFIDRKKELEDSLLVCERIIRGSVGGIFILGGRASGKTSFLNILQLELQKMNNIAVKISLDSTMVADGNEELLFKTMIRETLLQVKFFDLVPKKDIDKLVDFVRGFGELEANIEVPGIKLLIKKGAKKEEPQFLYYLLKNSLDDILTLIKGEGDKGIIFLFDEGDLLSKNRKLLEIFRNVFQDTPRIGLAISGTYRLLENINDIFSPIPRFFEKISLGAYPDEETMLEAITRPFEYANEKIFHEETLLLEGHFKIFNERIKDLTRRMPMEINLLCHYAFNNAAENYIQRETVVELYFNVDKKLLDDTMNQLRGTVNYSDFINSLDAYEIDCMKIIASSKSSLSLEELNILVHLDQLEQAIIEWDIDKIINKIKEDKIYLIKYTEEKLEKIIEKSKKFSLDVISKNILIKTLFSVNDEWIASYFKIGIAKRAYDLERAKYPNTEGVIMFRDPISSIIHNIFFLRLLEPLKGQSRFKVRSEQGLSSGYRLPQMERQYIIIDYRRIADDLPYYYILSLRNDFQTDQLKGNLLGILSLLKEKNIISTYQITRTII